MVHIGLVVKTTEPIFEPPLSNLEVLVDQLITAMVESAHRLPRVEHTLFTDLEGMEMVIQSVELNDEVVISAKNQALEYIRANFTGAQK